MKIWSVATVAAKRDGAAGEGFAEADDVGSYAGLFAGEHRAGAAEAGEDFVEDQQDVVALAEFFNFRENIGRVEFHAAGALDERLDDDRRRFLAIFR